MLKGQGARRRAYVEFDMEGYDLLDFDCICYCLFAPSLLFVYLFVGLSVCLKLFTRVADCDVTFCSVFAQVLQCIFFSQLFQHIEVRSSSMNVNPHIVEDAYFAQRAIS